MKNVLLTLTFLIAICTSVFSQDLPRHLTEDEKILMQTYQPPIDRAGIVAPPSKPVRTMAEWEEAEGILIAWTSYTTILRQIVDYAQEEGLVYIVCSDSNTVKTFLTSGGVPLTNLKFITASFNSIWCRDYGPWSVYSDIADSLYIIDWIYNRPRPNDDLIPSVFANYTGLPLYQTTVAPNNLTHTGGNFMADGHGAGLSSKLILNENSGKTEAQINTIMYNYMGINPYIKMDNLPYDGIHHIDMHMKLLDEETLLVGEYPAGVADGPYIEANLQYVLNNFKTCYGRPYKVVRIPMPPDQYGSYPNNGGDYRTYTNSLIINKTVIVPTYGLQYDTTALRIYREAMPGYNVVGINCNQIISASGAIHCITKEIGVREPVFISHKKITSVIPTESGYEVKAFIKTRTGINSAYIFWSVDTANGFNQVQMSQTTPDTFAAFIPYQTMNTKIWYYLEAHSNSGRIVKKPLTSPGGAYSFTVDYDIPVELLTFNAEVINNSVLFVWQTATELNNKGFSLERKEKESNTNWITVTWIEGNGTTTEMKSYSFIDENVQSGIYEYRLLQYDYDGTMKVISTIEVKNVIVPVEFSLSQNYPNPFNPVTTIKFSIPTSPKTPLISKGEVVTLRVYDMLGREVATLVNEEKQPGTYEVQFSVGSSGDASGLSSGIYFYRLTAGSFVETKKLILMK